MSGTVVALPLTADEMRAVIDRTRDLLSVDVTRELTRHLMAEPSEPRRHDVLAELFDCIDELGHVWLTLMGVYPPRAVAS